MFNFIALCLFSKSLLISKKQSFWFISTGVPTLNTQAISLFGTVPVPHHYRNRFCLNILHFPYFSSLVLKLNYLFMFLFLNFTSSGIATSMIWQIFSCLFTTTRSGLRASKTWSVCILNPVVSYNIHFLSTCSYHMLIPFICSLEPTLLSCLFLFNFCAIFGNALTMWDIVSPIWLHALQLGLLLLLLISLSLSISFSLSLSLSQLILVCTFLFS